MTSRNSLTVRGALAAELGNVGGTYINMVTKSGGNEFRGEAAIYHTDGGLQSDNLDDEQREAGMAHADITDYEDWSFNLGGPIVRDKLWFNAAVGTRNVSVPLSGFPENYEESGFDWYNYALSPVLRHYTLAGSPLMAAFGNFWGGLRTPAEMTALNFYAQDTVTQLDLRVEKVFSVGSRPLELGLVLDVFNAFNENAVTGRQSSTGTYSPATGAYAPSPRGFAAIRGVQQLRTIRFGARLRF